MQECIFTAAELHASASTPHSYTHNKPFLNPDCISAFPLIQSEILNHQVNGSSGVKPPRRTARATGAASAIARAPSPPWSCRIWWWDPKGISPLPQVGSKLKCIELVSTTCLCDGLQTCSRSLLRTSHSSPSFSSGNCYRVPFGSASTSHQQWMDGWAGTGASLLARNCKSKH